MGYKQLLEITTEHPSARKWATCMGDGLTHDQPIKHDVIMGTYTTVIHTYICMYIVCKGHAILKPLSKHHTISSDDTVLPHNKLL